MKKDTAFTRDFTLMVIGQIISLFGNSILRFALSLYILDVSGSATLFGSILAITMIPMLILSPVGGSLADRVNRRNIMVTLDFLTAGVCILFRFCMGSDQMILMIGIVMVILAIIQSFYQPSVQSSIPLLVDDKHLMRANGIVVQVSALANLVGPILGGVLYGICNLQFIVMISAAAFFMSAIMEIFIRIPFIPQITKGRAWHIMISDLKQALQFIRKDNPILFKILMIIALLDMCFSAFFMIGLPYIIKITLGLSSQLYGIAEGMMALGSIFSGLCIGFISNRFSFQKSYRFLIAGGIAILPIAVVLCLQVPPMISYVVILVSIFASLASIRCFNIFGQTYLQQKTPTAMLGKVSAFVTTICMCSTPIGQAIYGVIFDVFQNQVWIIVLLGIVIELMLGLLAKKSLKKLENA